MKHDIAEILSILKEQRKEWRKPVVTEIADCKRDPFKILISTIISLRTKDEVTREATVRLFQLADTPQKMKGLDIAEIEKAIYPAGFYHNKASTIIDVCNTLVRDYAGIVPDEIDELLQLKGVGRKTANLVVSMGYGKPAICVDTHVHRISNRLGYIRTKTPKDTEYALRETLPIEHWIEYNDLLVSFGQNVCKPVSPLCSECPIHDHCMRVGVTIHR